MLCIVACGPGGIEGPPGHFTKGLRNGEIGTAKERAETILKAWGDSLSEEGQGSTITAARESLSSGRVMEGYVLLWLAVARQAYLDLLESGRPGTAYDFLFSENETFETVIEVCGLDPDYVRSILQDRLRQAWKQKPYRHINQDDGKAWWTNGEPVCGHWQGGTRILAEKRVCRNRYGPHSQN